MLDFLARPVILVLPVLRNFEGDIWPRERKSPIHRKPSNTSITGLADVGFLGKTGNTSIAGLADF